MAQRLVLSYSWRQRIIVTGFRGRGWRDNVSYEVWEDKDRHALQTYALETDHSQQSQKHPEQ